MNRIFYKYQGAGNDFIIIINHDGFFNQVSKELISNLCDRKFGIGADGLILINECREADFEMIYFNSDGNESSMCGNGGRCVIALNYKEGLIGKKAVFKAIDGFHEGVVLENATIKIKMQDIEDIEIEDSIYIIDSGSTHYVKFVENVKQIDLVNEGRKIRNSDRFKSDGVNVNFAQIEKDHIFLRTYERGVEDETLSCGTGVVATAVANAIKGNNEKNTSTLINTPGGQLKVQFKRISENKFEDIWLEGPTQFVFQGELNVDVS